MAEGTMPPASCYALVALRRKNGTCAATRQRWHLPACWKYTGSLFMYDLPECGMVVPAVHCIEETLRTKPEGHAFL